MYSLLIADDEQDKREALREMIDWQKYDVEIVGEAGTGQEALDMLLRLTPDICIMDIRMPVMDGLEAMRRASEQGIATKHIIFSGYDDFAYAQKALELNTVEYLLKPCRMEEILQAVLKAANRVDEERNRGRMLEEYQLLFESYTKTLKERFLLHVATGSVRPGGDTESRIKTFQLADVFCNFAVCILSLMGEGLENSERSQLLQNAIHIAEVELSCVTKSEVFTLDEQVVMFVSLPDTAALFCAFQESLERIIDRIMEQYNTGCIIGVSDLKSGVDCLREGYLEALETTGFATFAGESKIRFYAELDQRIQCDYPSKEETAVLAAVTSGTVEVTSAIESFFEKYKSKSAESRKIMQQGAVTLVCSIFKTCVEHDLNPDQLSGLLNETIDEIINSQMLEEIKGAVHRFTDEASKGVSGGRKMSALTSAAIRYIKENYNQKIYLETVSEMLHISPSYLSMLFKQQTGLNFVEYLNRYRIRKSKEYLQEVGNKVFEVAYKVGFQDEKYFFSLFKRYTGLTATQYRDSVSGKVAEDDSVTI